MNLYRKTTIGEALIEALQDMKEKNEVSEPQNEAILEAFDTVKTLHLKIQIGDRTKTERSQ